MVLTLQSDIQLKVCPAYQVLFGPRRGQRCRRSCCKIVPSWTSFKQMCKKKKKVKCSDSNSSHQCVFSAKVLKNRTQSESLEGRFMAAQCLDSVWKSSCPISSKKAVWENIFEVKDLMCQDFCTYCMSEIINEHELDGDNGLNHVSSKLGGNEEKLLTL